MNRLHSLFAKPARIAPPGASMRVPAIRGPESGGIHDAVLHLLK